MNASGYSLVGVARFFDSGCFVSFLVVFVSILFGYLVGLTS